jgi:hypothetical protein
MATTLCDGVDTIRMVATPIEDSQEVLFSQPPINQISIGDIHVDHLLVDQPIGPPVNGPLVGKIHVCRSLVSQPHVGQPHIMVVPP